MSAPKAPPAPIMRAPAQVASRMDDVVEKPGAQASFEVAK